MVLKERLEVRLPVEADRLRFVELFQDPVFMEFSAGVHDLASANARFDMMLQTAERVPFAKQPIIERSSGEIVGYSGAAWFEFEGAPRLEFGYRLVPSARGHGYATEAGLAVLAVAADSFRGELLAPAERGHVHTCELGWSSEAISSQCEPLPRRAPAAPRRQSARLWRGR
jgi:RimJ/RimL family protein N-acetyltransferase